MLENLNMFVLKKSFLCYSVNTGTCILGCIGIIGSILCLVPNVLVLKDIDYYAEEYVRTKINEGKDYHESDVPDIRRFSRNMLASSVAIDVIFTFTSILLIAGITSAKRLLLIPWLFLTSVGIGSALVVVIAVMFGFKNELSVFTFFVTAPFFTSSIYFWLIVYSAFINLRNDYLTQVTQPTLSSISGKPTKSEVGSAVLRTKREKNMARYHQYQYLSESQAQSDNLVVSFEPPSLGPSEENSRSLTQLTHSASMSSFDSAKSSVKRALVGGTSPPPPYESLSKNFLSKQNSSTSSTASSFEESDSSKLANDVRNRTKQLPKLHEFNDKIRRSKKLLSRSSDNLELASVSRRKSSSASSTSSKMSGPTILMSNHYTKENNFDNIETLDEE